MKSGGGAKTRGVERALDHFWPGNIPDGLSAKERNNTVRGMHPVAKPVALVADAIRDCSKRGQIVLDPFAGSGTTLIAAEKTGRRALLIEFDPAYCDSILRRFAQVTGREARLAATGEEFEAVMESRGTSVSLSHEQGEMR
jgi:DNA modification methylase